MGRCRLCSGSGGSISPVGKGAATQALVGLMAVAAQNQAAADSGTVDRTGADGARRRQLEAALSCVPLQALMERAEDAAVEQALLEAAQDRTELIELIVARVLAGDNARRAQLKDELARTPLKALTERAAEAGVAEVQLESVHDRAELIELILQTAMPPIQPPPSLPCSSNSRRAELAQWRVRGLRAAARDAGASESTIEACLEAGDTPKAALVELVLRLQCEQEAAVAAAGGERQKREQLSRRPLVELRRLAMAAGATQDETDDVLDDEGLAGQVEAMIALIRTYEQAGPKPTATAQLSRRPDSNSQPSNRPHFGVPRGQGVGGDAVQMIDSTVFRGRWVMLS
jgi:hypothetical protein